MKLTEWTSCGGCAAKWGGAPLRRIIGELETVRQPDLLVGLDVFDDAAVYRLSDGLALVSTTDFFPPLVDQPDDFGAIAAANACSDVFAMGGQVILALNIAAFPEDFPPDAIDQILSAASAKVREAGGTIAGGHTIRSPEPIFGLAVQGTIDPGRVWSKGGGRPGDRLLLSKPLGTGIVLAGGDEQTKRAAIEGMRTLNRRAATELSALGPQVHAVTDVTGFGLAGHSWEMAERASARMVIDSGSLPLYGGCAELAASGVRTGGEARNRAYLSDHLEVGGGEAVESIVLDPQTSGGLLAAVTPGAAGALASGGWWEIGEVDTGPAAVLIG